MTTMTSWFEIKNAAGGAAELLIYDEIGPWALSAKEFVTALDRVRGRKLTVRIHSPGGDPFSAVAMYNALLRRDGAVTTIADSLAASAASVVFMAGSRRLMARHSTLMVHDSSGLAAGGAATMEKMREMLAQIDDTIAGVYASRTGRPASFWRQEMANETWYDTDQAIAVGLAHEVAAPSAANLAVAGRVFNLSKYRNVPAWAQAAPSRKNFPTSGSFDVRDDATLADLARSFGYSSVEAYAKATYGSLAAARASIAANREQRERERREAAADTPARRRQEEAIARQMGISNEALQEQRRKEGRPT